MPVISHDHTFVGMGSIVMDGAIIETDGMLAAGSLLTPRKHIPARELWAGRPARKLRDLSDGEIADNRQIAQHYMEVGRAHRLGAAGGPFVNMHAPIASAQLRLAKENGLPIM